MIEETTYKNGVTVYAEYNGGQSRYGEHAVDYMLVRIGDVELYAETLPAEDGESFEYSDRGTFEVLGAEIARQAEEKGIDLDDYNPLLGGYCKRN